MKTAIKTQKRRVRRSAGTPDKTKPQNPYLRALGAFKDDPMFAELVEIMKKNREIENAAILD